MISLLLKAFVKLTTLGMKTGSHMTRFKMYREVKRILAPYKHGRDVLDISGSSDLVALLDHPTKVTKAVFRDPKLPHLWTPVPDGAVAASILDLPFDDNSFDYLFADQVLEHVEGNPHKALAETARVLRPGGIAIHTTCFMQEPHEEPKDFWRFSTYGLELLCKENGLKVIESGCWGNRLAFFGLRYLKIPEAAWHPLHMIAMWTQMAQSRVGRTPAMPMITWVVASK